MLKRTSIFAASIATLSSAAFAGGLAEAPVEAPVAEPPVVTQAAPSFQQSAFAGGYVGGQLGYADINGTASVEGDGALYGLHAGYNFQVGQGYLVGVEVDYDFGEVDIDPALGTLDSVARLKVRGGADVGGVFVYGTGGVATADGSDIGSDNGQFLGFGAAYDLGNQITVGGEYLFHQFEDYDDSGIDVDVNTLSARVSYNF